MVALRNPLTFPGGTPGFDPLHPAAGKSMRFSGVAVNGGFISLFHGGTVAKVGTITTVFDPIIGPCMAVNTGSAYGKFTNGVFNEQPSSITCAAIMNPTTTIGNGWIFGLDGDDATAANRNVFQINNLNPNLSIANTNVQDTNLLMTTGKPYFFAVTFNGSLYRAVLVNLATGKTLLGSASVTQAFGTSTAAQYNIGGTTLASVPMDGSLAAVMVSVNTFLTQKQLDAWGRAPWDFWYPQTVRTQLIAAVGRPAANAAKSPTLPLTGYGAP